MRLAEAWLMRNARGLTLIEIMIVMLILGMLATMIGVSVFKSHEAAKLDTARLEVRALYNAVGLYRAENGRLPDSLRELVPRQIDELNRDPWGHDYNYRHSNSDFEIISYGPDGAPGGGDDIVKRSAPDRE